MQSLYSVYVACGTRSYMRISMRNDIYSQIVGNIILYYLFETRCI
jgi:hypothetical protein